MAAITSGGPWRSPNDRIETSAPSSVRSVARRSSSRTPSARSSSQSALPPGRTVPRRRGPSKLPPLSGAVRRVPCGTAPMFCGAATVTRSVMSSRVFMALPPSKSAPVGFPAYVGTPKERPLIVRRPEVREPVEQIVMRPDLISRHFPVCENRKEDVNNVVLESPTILRIGCRPARVVGKNVWQQLSRGADRVLTRVAARVFQLVCKDADEASIIRWLPAEIRVSLLPGEKNRLQWSSTAVCLDPAFPLSIHCASPDSHLFVRQSRVRQFKHDAAHILIGEEIITSKLHVVEEPVCVEEERIAAPATKKAAIVRGRDRGFPPDGHRRILDENFALVAHSSG